MAKEKQSLVNRLAERFGIADGNQVFDALKQTAFSNGGKEPTNAQMMALLIVAEQHGLNPWTKEIYAFPDKRGGIIPVVGVDGWIRILNDHPQFDGYEFRESEEIVSMKGAKPCPSYIECTLFRRDRSHHATVREYLDERYQPARKYPGPWQTNTKTMLRHKAIIQCARIAFGFSGIYDSEDAMQIQQQQEKEIDMGTVEIVEETPKETPQPVVSHQQQPVIEHQQQPDLMGQITGNQMQEKQPEYEQAVVVESQPAVSVEQQSYVQSVQADHGSVQQEAQSPSFMPRVELVGHAKNLVDQTTKYKSWSTSYEYAKNTWQGDEQAYVLSELKKAHQAASQTH